MESNRSDARLNQTNNKALTAPKRALLFGARFILCTVIVFVCFQLLFNNFIETSPYWQIILNTERDNIDTNSFGEVLEKTQLDQSFDENGNPYYKLEDFPKGIVWGTVWARITVEGTDLVDEPVYCGDSEDLLNRGVCKYFGSYFPGEGGNIVLSAHVMQQFYCLEDLPVGTKIKLDTIYGEYVYEIYDTVIFSVDDTSYILGKPSEERLVMYTCYPRGYAYRTQRYAVLCKKLTGANWR